MHELSVLEGLLELMEDQARSSGFTRVKRVILGIGQLSCVEPEAMTFCFASVVAGTLAEDAALEINQIPGAGRCPACDREVPMSSRLDPCPHCGRYQLQVTAGSDIRLEALDVL